MTPNATQLITAHLVRDSSVLRDMRRRLTLQDEPVGIRDRIEHTMRHKPCGYATLRNERVIRTNGRLGPLRLALVQWATQYAPPAIGGFGALLTWALRQVDWPTVVRDVAVAPERLPRRSAMPVRRVAYR